MSGRSRTFQIQDVTVGPGHAPFVIAEMSGNHNGELERALKILEAAAAAGAHAIKLQTYTADTMTLDIKTGEFLIDDPKSLWTGRNLYDLYREAHTPWAWHAPLMKRARELGIVCFSTPFDATAVDLLEELGAPAYKIASFEIVDLPLIRRVARTGKPMIMSTGMASPAEISDAVEAARSAGCKDLCLLKCTSSYPAPPEHSNLLTIPHLMQMFDVQVGLSDHTMGIGVAVASVALGATVIEKHFTLSREEGGVDAAFSLEPAELKALCVESDRARQAIGGVGYGPHPSEALSLRHRRSLYVVEDMKKGDRLSPENLRAIRPGAGLPPKYFEALLGRAVNRDVPRGTPAAWDLLG
jgi:N-acetylneuraminate synthase